MTQGVSGRREDRTRITKERAVFKPTCDICNNPVPNTKRFFEWWRDCTCKEGKFLRDRGNADERQRRLERTNKLRATDLEDRDLAQKEKAMARRESRQDSYDAEPTEPAAELTFADFGQEITSQDVEKLPSAFVRDDGETLLYEGVANTILVNLPAAKVG